MREKTQDLLKKFEHDYRIYVSATDAQTYWIIHARVPKSELGEFPPLQPRKKYISGPDQNGSVLILSDSRSSDTCMVESWGPMETFDDFVKKALSQIMVDKNVADKGVAEGCGTGRV